MARTKKLDIKVVYGDTGYVINDLGIGKNPRFELYNIKEKKSIKKSNCPLDFDTFLDKIFDKNNRKEK